MWKWNSVQPLLILLAPNLFMKKKMHQTNKQLRWVCGVLAYLFPSFLGSCTRCNTGTKYVNEKTQRYSGLEYKTRIWNAKPMQLKSANKKRLQERHGKTNWVRFLRNTHNFNKVIKLDAAVYHMNDAGVQCTIINSCYCIKALNWWLKTAEP